MLELLWHSRQARQLPWRCDCGQPHETRVLAAVRFVVERRICKREINPQSRKQPWKAAQGLASALPRRRGWSGQSANLTPNNQKPPLSLEFVLPTPCRGRSWMSWMSWLRIETVGRTGLECDIEREVLGWPGTAGHRIQSLPLSRAGPDAARSVSSPARLESCWPALRPPTARPAVSPPVELLP